MKNKMNQMKPDQIERFTQEMIGKMMPKHVQGIVDPQEMLKGFFPIPNNQPSEVANTLLKYSVFETHDYVYIRIEVEQEEWLKAIKIYYTSNQFIIEQIPTIDDKHTLTLPASVKKKGATASMKDGTLEIKLLKSTHMHYSEIDISQLK